MAGRGRRFAGMLVAVAAVAGGCGAPARVATAPAGEARVRDAFDWLVRVTCPPDGRLIVTPVHEPPRTLVETDLVWFLSDLEPSGAGAAGACRLYGIALPPGARPTGSIDLALVRARSVDSVTFPREGGTCACRGSAVVEIQEGRLRVEAPAP